MILQELFQKSWKTIISPPKIPHRISSLGPKEQVIDGKTIKRLDFTISNDNAINLSGFLFYSPEIQNPDLVLYLHGNGGSKTEALDLVKCITKYQFAVSAFDFVGCGNSGEEYLTYGVYEIYDVKKIIAQIKKHLCFKKITLWGRSMGAVTSIMFAQNYPNQISSLVLDVPFTNLDGVVKRAAYKESTLPHSLINMFLYFVKRKCEDQTQLDIFSINYLESFKRLYKGVSILFLYSKSDRIVPAEQVFKFYNIFSGRKQICQISQDHEQDRRQQVFMEGLKWIKRWNGSANTGVKRIQNLIQEGDFTKNRQNCNC